MKRFAWFVALTGMLLAVDANCLIAQAASRSFRDVSWVRVGGIRAAVESDLLNPWLLRVTADQIVVYDGGDNAVKAFGYDGTLQWTVGRSGQGPGEFRHPTDLQIAANGEVWLLDPGNTRITVLRPDGRIAREIRVPAGVIRAVPITANEFWGVRSDGPDFIVKFSATGQELGRIDMPSALDTLPGMVRESNVSPGSGPYQMAIGFVYSDRFLVYRADGVVDLRGADNLAFPSLVSRRVPIGVATGVDPDALELGGTLGVSGNLLYAHARGRDPRFVDIMDLQAGTYRETLILPDSAYRIAIVPGTARIGYIYADPAPGVNVVEARSR